MSRNIAIGDIHGCAKTLKFLVEEKIRPDAEDRLYFLGDYVNKGPDSRGVVDYILGLKRSGVTVECLRGNHDQLMLDAWKDSEYLADWISRGGDATLDSFKCRSLADIPMTYYSFLAMTTFFVEVGGFILVHAGLNFEIEDIYSDIDAMLNLREMDVDLQKTEDHRIIHGHVPVELSALREKIETPWKEISLDTGCVYTDQFDKGYLSAMVLETSELIFVKNKDTYSHAN